jgi:hypothetical protein
MSTLPRRRIIRPASPPASPPADRQAQKLRARLEKERAMLARRVVKLKRAFHAFEKSQQTVVRLERKVNELEE